MSWSSFARAGEATYLGNRKNIIDQLLNNQGCYRFLHNKIFYKT